MNSIRRKLLRLLLSLLAVLALVLGVVTYEVAKYEVDELYDANLEEVATVMQWNHWLPHKAEPFLAPMSMQSYLESGDEFLVQVWDKEGNIEYTSHIDRDFPVLSKAGLSTITFKDKKWRVWHSQAKNGVIQVAQLLDHQEEAIDGVVEWIMLVEAIFFFVFGGMIWLSVGSSLQPLSRISLMLAKRGPHALEPVSNENIPTEIQPLTNALNRLLRRLAVAMEAQRSFVADAAHELRTPLTAIHLQLAMLERAGSAPERLQAIETLKSGVNRAMHLVQQLLILARMEPEADGGSMVSVNMLRLITSCVAQFMPMAEEKNTDLGIHEASDVSIMGDSDALRVLLNNVIDNALRHTPSGGKIDIALREEGDRVVLEVSDSGKGIAESERVRVLDRFYRGTGSKTEGTGLGLSIVKAIADRHHAKILLSESAYGGLKLTVQFSKISA